MAAIPKVELNAQCWFRVKWVYMVVAAKWLARSAEDFLSAERVREQSCREQGSGASSSSRPRVSVAMGTYNGERFIRQQLESIAQQTLLPCELVVRDDASTDGTLTIVEEFASHAPFPVRIHKNDVRLGYPDNFMQAAILTNGDWIAFCDQDDFWLPQKLERVLAIAARQIGLS